MNEKFDYNKINEHEVTKKTIEMFEELRVRRDKYKKYGPLYSCFWNYIFGTYVQLREQSVFLNTLGYFSHLLRGFND